MEVFEHGKDRFIVTRTPSSNITIMLRGESNTYVICVFDPMKKIWDIEDIVVSSENKGIGQTLVSELVRQLGPGQSVSSYVIEPGTLKRVRQAGWAQTAKEHPVTLENPADLQALKFVRVMEGGGMETTKCVVAWKHYEEAGFSQQDMTDMVNTKNPLAHGDKVLTVNWFGRTPGKHAPLTTTPPA